MIYGERIRLRAIEREDLPRFVAWLNDPDVLQGLLIYLPLSLTDEENWYENMLKRPMDEHPLVIEIKQAEDWLPIGNCGFMNIDWRCRSGEVGIFIGEKQLWNQGYGTDAMNLLLKHGFNTLNLNRVALDVYDTNLRAVRSYEKAGFVHEGRKRQAIFKEGKYIDILQMSVLKQEWEGR
jgi:diamine N-acetyltransferase